MKVIIFCGGFGTRMWPASRKSFPKQFYPMLSGKSFFETTYKRFRKVFKPEDLFISTEERYVNFIKEQAPGLPKENIIVEPERRDTLGAVGLVAAVVAKKFPGEVIFFSWSDHIIGQEEKFLRAVVAAGNYSKEMNMPVSLNEEATYPNVHVGWVKPGESIDEIKGYPVRKIEKFVEKPDLATAKKLFVSGNYLFHTGYEAWPAELLLGYYKEYAPAVYEGLMKISDSWGTKNEKTILYREYHKFEKISVDFGVFEKIPSGKRLTIETNVGWEDSGTWELFYLALRKNALENVVEGEGLTEFIDSSSNLIFTPKNKMVTLIGVQDLVVIDTPTGLLVCSMKTTEKVKQLFKTIEEKNPEFVE